MTSRPFQLRSLTIGDEAGSWAEAGFAVDDETVTIGNTTIALVGADHRRGILDADVDGVDGDVDGMPFERPESSPPAAIGGVHPNGVTKLDHLVAMSPDMDRTVTALTDAGLDHRRSRVFEIDGQARRQAFFWLGDVILELAGDDRAHGEGPATLWGLAFTVTDLAATATQLGSRLGAAKPAVQPGREIATLRTREFDISVPIVVMSPQPATG